MENMTSPQTEVLNMGVFKKLFSGLTRSKLLIILACVFSSLFITAYVNFYVLDSFWLCLPVFVCILAVFGVLSYTAGRLFKAALRPKTLLLSMAVAILVLAGYKDIFFPSKQKVDFSLVAETAGEICLYKVMVDGESVPVGQAEVVENSGWLHREQWDNFMIWPEADGVENRLTMRFFAEEVHFGFPYTPYAGSVTIESSTGESGTWDLSCPEWTEGEEVKYADFSFDCHRVYSLLELLLYSLSNLSIIVFLCSYFLCAVDLILRNSRGRIEFLSISEYHQKQINQNTNNARSQWMRIFETSRFLLFVVICFFLLLVLFSEKWFLDTWDSNIEFSTIVYQLFSPLKGTSSEVMQSYLKSCVYPTFAIIILCCAVFPVIRRFVFFWETRIGERKVCLSSECPHRKAFFRLGSALAWAAMCCLIWVQAVEMGAADYIAQITERSAIFEEEYVSPRDVTISFPEKKRNLVLIYLESMETTFASVGVGGGKPANYIPELTELAFDNLFFSSDENLGGGYQANGAGWTMAALLAGSSGVPYKLGIANNAAGKYEEFLPGLVSMGDILLENGYRNYFMCGSDIAFAGREDYFQQHGDYTLIDLNTAREVGIVPSNYDNDFWGMEDEKLFVFAKDKLSEISAAGTPFNFTLLTVDTHRPDGYICSSCEEQYEEQYANALACSSRQTADFLAWMQEQDWYEDTTVIIVGDHLSMKKDFWDDIGDYERDIYNCFINLPDSLSDARTTNRVFTALDLFPSVLAAIDVEIEGERLGLGVNLFSEEETVPEKMGIEEFNYELGLYSAYYFRHFIAGK